MTRSPRAAAAVLCALLSAAAPAGEAAARPPAGQAAGSASVGPAAAVASAGGPADTVERAMVTDRPDFTESAVAVRRPQLEAGYTFDRSDGIGTHTLGEALLRIPAAASLELRAGLSSYRWTASDEGEEGFTDASVGAKLELVGGDAGAVPTVALLGAASLPVGAVGRAGVQPEGRVALAWTISHRVGLGANLGAAWRDDDRGRFTELVGSLALGVDAGGGIGLFVETYGVEPTGGGRPGASYVDGGLTLGLGPDLQLDARLGAGLGESAGDVVGGVGVSVRR